MHQSTFHACLIQRYYKRGNANNTAVFFAFISRQERHSVFAHLDALIKPYFYNSSGQHFPVLSLYPCQASTLF